MLDSNLRRTNQDDLGRIISFFKKAYGPHTVFQSPEFLTYYFRNPWNPERILSSNWIGLNENREVVSHYGGLEYKMILNDKLLQVVWGVNAYTLPDFRGLGFNGNLVKRLFEENSVNATLGMSFETQNFYEKLGYQVFDHLRFSRFILNFSEDSFLIIADMSQNVARAKQLVPVVPEDIFPDFRTGFKPIEKQKLKDLAFNLGIQAQCTTLRDKEFINWRFLDNPFIDYQVFVEIEEEEVRAYAVLRVEKLLPSGKNVGRIIDLYGKKELIDSLIEKVKIWSLHEGHIYLDFSKIGDLYTDELLKHGFSKLEEEDVSLFPQVSSPVENRPNQEYLALQSVNFDSDIQALRVEDIYFTRIDSDRDRIAKIEQIITFHGE